MKKSTKYFIYFIIAAPILAKIIEWLFQLASSGTFEVIKSVWWMQILFIETLAIILYLLLFYSKIIKIEYNPKNLAMIVGFSYFLKEVYNWTFHFSLKDSLPIGLVALIIEPVFMYTILGLFLPKLIFKEIKCQ